MPHSELNLVAERGWAEMPGWLPAAEASSLLDVGKRLHELGSFKRAGVGRGSETKLKADVRRDEIRWLEREQDPAIDALFDRLESLRTELNREFFLGLKDFEAHFARYDVGGFYDRHVDRFRTDDARTISAVLYLNDDWKATDGGELMIYVGTVTIKIAPTLGKLALFRSDTIEHAVAPSAKPRWSVAIWFRR